MLMMPKIVGLVVITCVLGADIATEQKEDPASITEALPPLYTAFHQAFEKEQFTDDQIKTLETRFYQERIDTNKWPFTDRGKELALSLKNPSNDNSAQVAEAVRQAGGDPADVKTLTPEVAVKSLKILENIGSEESSMLQTGSESQVPPSEPILYNIATNAQNTYAALQYIETGLSMTAGSVASNTAAINGLAAAVSNNAGNLALPRRRSIVTRARSG